MSDPGSGAPRPWWKGATLYQIYPRSFADSNGDGVGDLPGITARLEHVAGLGVDGIWLSPFYRSPMDDFGYDVADHCAVDPLFGTLEDFDRLVARAHALGLKVVVDQVWSHTSDRHPWFAESRAGRTGPKADWYVWADPRPDGTPPNNWQSVFHGPAWKWDARRGQYFLHNFLPSQPDLNLHLPEVREAVLAIGRFWLDRGVDGFRFDALNYLLHDPALRDDPLAPPGPRTRPYDFQSHVFSKSHPDAPAFLERARALLDAYPDRFAVAEVVGADALAEMKAFTSPGRLHSAYGFDFLYADRLTPGGVRRALEAWTGAAEEGWPSWAFSNHDAPRAVSRWAEGREPAAFAKLCLLLLLSLRGTVFLYQGEELGLPQAEVPFERLRDPEAIENWPATLGRDGARTPMPWRAQAADAGFGADEPWLPVPQAHRALAVDRQTADPDSVLAFAGRAVRFRRGEAALTDGDIRFLDAPADALAFVRGTGPARRRLCVFNLGREPLRWRPDGAGRVLLGAGVAEGGAAPETLPVCGGYVAELDPGAPTPT